MNLKKMMQIPFFVPCIFAEIFVEDKVSADAFFGEMYYYTEGLL